MMARKLTDGERLILYMLGDLYKNLKLKNPEIDPDFVMRAVAEGHDWALKYKYSGIFPTEPDTEQDVRETHDILTMFRVLQSSYERLSPADKKRVDTAVPPYTGEDLYFAGFDGNHDNHHGIAHYMVEELGLYEEQKGRAMDSHMNVLETYRRMHETYRNCLGGLSINLSADQLIEVLKSRTHPSNR
jgi:uncharacterized protein YfbU (UPF0304 family)